MAPVLTASLTQLRHDFNDAFPERGEESDGWIGDFRHQQGVSGHNPDDTQGSKSESSDADTKAEVRAVDVDKDLNSSKATMQTVVDRMLQTPNDLKRLKYIIFDRHIWRKSQGWKREVYTGDNPHDKHAHFSGDPLFDEDASPWSVLTWKEDGMSGYGFPTADDALALMWNMEALISGREQVASGPLKGHDVWLVKAIKSLQADLDVLLTKPVMSNEQLQWLAEQMKLSPLDTRLIRQTLCDVLLHGAADAPDVIDGTPE